MKFKVIGEATGEPIGFASSVVRYFAHFLDAIVVNVGYLLPLVTAKRQTIADMVMNTVCIPAEPMGVQPGRAPHPKIRMALGVVVLAAAATLTVLACHMSFGSMLGNECNWVRNVRANDGFAVIDRRGRRQVRLTEVPIQSRPPLLKAYLQQVPGARPHLPVKHTQPVEDFASIAGDYPIFRVEFRADRH